MSMCGSTELRARRGIVVRGKVSGDVAKEMRGLFHGGHSHQGSDGGVLQHGWLPKIGPIFHLEESFQNHFHGYHQRILI